MSTKSKQVFARPGQSLGQIYKRLVNASWAVVHVASVENEEANGALIALLRQKLSSLHVVAVPKADIEATPFAVVMIRAQIESAGLGLSGVPIGYYLLRNGRLVGFDAAIPTLDELKAGAAFGIGAGLFALIFGADGFRSLDAGATVASAMWGTGAAGRAFARFSEIIDSINASEAWTNYKQWWQSQQWKQKRVNEDEFANACAILGIGADATEAEFKSAYRTRAKACHSDLNHGHDDRAMVALNAAKDFYEAKRGWK